MNKLTQTVTAGGVTVLRHDNWAIRPLSNIHILFSTSPDVLAAPTAAIFSGVGTR